MGHSSQNTFRRDNRVLTASAIGQYHFCSVSWYLQHHGFRPESPALERGLQQHQKMGEAIETTTHKAAIIRILQYSGCAFLIGSLLLFALEVGL
jgi:hypothetical protein